MVTYPVLAKNHTVAYVGTYPPKECGIATFTMDMVNATDLAGWRSVVVAVDDIAPTEPHEDPKVIHTIEKEDKASYRKTARLLAERGISLLAIQHEYGIFGGDHGDYVLDLARAATMPVIVTLHTVLPNPSEPQRRILKELEKSASFFVVMAHTAVELLHDSYGISPQKVRVIPHGAPNVPYGPEEHAKIKFHLQGQRVISTFGLISPNKGIEDAISAMPAVVAQVPNAIYLVLGQTHPVIKRREGEWYREKLVRQVHELGMDEHVRFVDQYLSLQQLIDYLLATDVYVTPYYANPHQITSGTLAYAVAAGKVVVSTPYLYAKELLSEERGFLYPFRDTQALANTITRVMTDDALYDQTRRNAYEFGRSMTWQSVGLQYTKLFVETINERWINHRAAMDTIAIPGLAEMSSEGEVWAPPAVSGIPDASAAVVSH